MNITDLFDFGFDIALVALILFIINFINHSIHATPEQKKHHHYFISGIILALIISVMAIGYGGSRLSATSLHTSNSNRIQIENLKQKLLEHQHKTKRQSVAKPKTRVKKLKLNGPLIRVVNAHDAQNIRQKTLHRQTKVDLVARVEFVHTSGNNILVRGVHSQQFYQVHSLRHIDINYIRKGYYVVIRGITTKVNGAKIRVKTDSIVLQTTK